MKVVISAGGTGGHIYPALAIIEKIKEMEPDSQFLYIGTHNRMEKDIVPKRNIPFESIEMYGFNKKHLLKNFKTIKCLFKGYKKCLKLIKDFNPDVVIGVGGYITVPVIIAAKKLGYKTFIHEQNSIPGKSNKFLVKYCDLIGVSFPSTLKYFPSKKAVLTGNPCGDEATKCDCISKSSLGFSDDKKLILITMGSLGSISINRYLMSVIDKFEGKDYNVLIITGKSGYDEFSKCMLPNNVKILPFYEGLNKVMKITDLMISRAGASTLSELIALSLPTILIPSPYVANNHQYMNAKDLIDSGGAVMIEEKELKGNKLINTIDKMMNNSFKLNEMKLNLKKLKVDDSAFIIYKELLKIINKN